MADNVPVTPGSGASIATDDIGGVQYQRVKITFGADGTATDASSGNPLPVSVISLPLPTGAALDATLTGGTQQTKITDGTNVASVAACAAASSETAVDRLKVNAALRLLDTSQAAGSQLVAAKGDQTAGLWVNVKNAALATGAATESSLAAINLKTPAIGTAGSPATDILTVQGALRGTPQNICLPQSTKNAISANEQFNQMFAAQAATVHLLSQILAAMRGQAAPLPDEEADKLIGEFIDQRNLWTNIIQ